MIRWSTLPACACMWLALGHVASAIDLVALTGQFTAENHQYAQLGVPRINSSGEVAYSAGLKLSPTATSLRWSIWKVGDDAWRIAMERDLIAGATHFGSQNDDLQLDKLVLADTGQVAFSSSFATASGTPSGFGIVVADEQGTAIVVRNSTAVPGGVTIHDFTAPVFSNDGHVAFRGQYVGGPSSASDHGVWIGPPGTGQLQLVARAGIAAPGTSSSFQRFNTDVRIGSGGKVAFKADLATEFTEAGGWVGDGSSLTKIFETHAETAPGTTAQLALASHSQRTARRSA